MKTLKISDKTHKKIIMAKLLYSSKSMSEIIDKAMDELCKDHILIYGEIKPNDK